MRAIFGEFVLDIGRRELSRRSEPLHVSRKALQLLEQLLRAAPDAVSKEQLYQYLWQDVFVDETNIANLVSELRKALGDERRGSRLIRTLYRFGYRFDGNVKWEGTESEGAHGFRRSWISWASRDYPLKPGANIIGRDPDAKVSIDSAAISRRHALLTLAEKAVIEDLGSKNGTFVGGERITGPVEIHDGDTVGLGSIRILFRTQGEPPTTVTELRAPSSATPRTPHG